MPTRLIRDSICKSDSIDELTWFEEVFFYRLITICDDYGRYDARHKVLKADMFPLKDGVTLAQIEKALDKLSTVGMVQVYMYDQKPFLQLVTWGKYQNIRNHKSKYPQPPPITDGNGGLNTDEYNCIQKDANVPVIQSESESESESDILSGKPTVYAQIIGYLNQKCGTDYKPGSKSTKEHINARLKEGFKFDDFIAVIDKKHFEWHNRPDMAQYLRPQTLFGTKFESYLNQPMTDGKKRSTTDLAIMECMREAQENNGSMKGLSVFE